MLNTPPGYDPAGYAERFGTGFPSNLPMRFVRASLGARFVAYLLDILFILGFTALLTLAITVLGVLTFGLGWTLFAILPASGNPLQRGDGGRRRPEHLGHADDGFARGDSGQRPAGGFPHRRHPRPCCSTSPSRRSCFGSSISCSAS